MLKGVGKKNLKSDKNRKIKNRGVENLQVSGKDGENGETTEKNDEFVAGSDERKEGCKKEEKVKIRVRVCEEADA
ncbi:MAG: hypothetical protein L6265_05760 [Thermoplasmatales archaeon]|nr:hypothetical protein [Thermoplasmatales archaeon]